MPQEKVIRMLEYQAGLVRQLVHRRDVSDELRKEIHRIADLLLSKTAGYKTRNAA